VLHAQAELRVGRFGPAPSRRIFGACDRHQTYDSGGTLGESTALAQGNLSLNMHEGPGGIWCAGAPAAVRRLTHSKVASLPAVLQTPPRVSSVFSCTFLVVIFVQK